MGPYSFVAPRLNAAVQGNDSGHAKRAVKYVGRRSATAVAAGKEPQHVSELNDLLSAAFEFDSFLRARVHT